MRCVPAERCVGLGAAVQLGTVPLGWGQGLFFWLGGGLGTPQEALPQGVLRQRLGATLIYQLVHDLLLGALGAQDVPTRHLAVGVLGMVTAVQAYTSHTHIVVV